jgi:alpha-beta hydrolase superfamily lysophospholipase
LTAKDLSAPWRRRCWCSAEPEIEAARRITIPIQFLLPWDDEEINRQAGIELFDAFASQAKTLHATPGGHHEVPWSRSKTLAGSSKGISGSLYMHLSI